MLHRIEEGLGPGRIELLAFLQLQESIDDDISTGLPRGEGSGIGLAKGMEQGRVYRLGIHQVVCRPDKAVEGINIFAYCRRKETRAEVVRLAPAAENLFVFLSDHMSLGYPWLSVHLR
ncbi:hypothetical protein SDC9_169835 [bioreactor metagenome]|uniref:Uncharacterized protein n=1 Tax=bioreactor metagenome TaxID=1076179 RepID=A0A645G900_9ZZZZ